MNDLKSRLYLVGYSLILFQAFINSTTFHWIFPNTLGIAVRLLGYMLLLLHVFRCRKVKISLFYVGVVMIGIFLLSFYRSGYPTLLDYGFCCVFAIDVDFEKIVKVYVYESIIMTITTIISATLGIIENYIYFRRTTGDIRLSLGFIYPTNFGAHVFFIMVGIAFLIYSKFDLKHVIIYGFTAYIVYLVTNARGPSAMILILAIIVYTYKSLNLKEIKFIPDWLLKYSSVICAILTLVMIHFYDVNNTLWEQINSFTTKRLIYAKNAMQNNTMTLFGQYIEQRGDGNGGRQAGEAYTYIDLSFQRILLMYGVFLFGFILIYSILLYRRAMKKNNVIVPLLLFVIAFYSLTAQHYFDFSYNFLLLAYFANIPIQNTIEQSGKRNSEL